MKPSKSGVRAVTLAVGFAYRAALDRAARLVMTDKPVPRLWELPTGRLRRALPVTGFRGHYADWDIGLSPDGRRAVASYSDHSTRVWDTATGEELLRWQAGSVATGMDVSRDRVLMGCRWTKLLMLHDLKTGAELLRVKGRTSCTGTVALSADGRRALTGGGDKKVHLWDLATGERLAELAGHTGRVMAVCFVPGGKTAVSASADRTVCVWDLKQGTRVRTLAGHGRIVGLVAVSSGGLQVASAARDRTVRVWRLADGSARVFTGHWGYLTALGFKPDGRSLVSVDQRGRVCTWDLRTSGDLSVPD